METVKIKKETFDKVANFKSKNPDCKNFDDALGLMISDLENSVQIQKDEAIRFQNGLHDKNNQLEKMQKELNSMIEAGTHGTEEQANEIARLQNEIADLKNQKAKDEQTIYKLENENINNEAEIDSLNEQISSMQNEQNANGIDATKYTLEIDALHEKNNQLQSRINEYEQADANGKIQLLQPVKQIMDLVAHKLSGKYKQTISVTDIINKMVLRYNVERWTEWFYPFCVSDVEIKQITGKTTDELKEFFNSKK